MPERASQLPQSLLAQVTQLLTAHTGLDFAGARAGDVERAMRAAARQEGAPDVEAYVQRLLGSPLTRAALQALAGHLTVGETYFFREKEALAVLEREIVPALKHRRRVRIWSAGCSTGEEAYSIAITLVKSVADLRDWSISILATDINPLALRKAAAGVYGEWSFRGTPAEVRHAFFRRTPEGRWQVSERVKSMVSFDYLNLAQDHFPAVENGTNAIDVIFCRNVLMYFEPTRAAGVLDSFARCLMPDGWLFLNPIEISRLAPPMLAAVNAGGTFAYRRAAPLPPRPAASAAAELPPIPAPQPEPAAVASAAAEQTPYARAAALYALGDYAGATKALAAATDAKSMSLVARACANDGRLDEALAWCEKAVSADKLNPARHYLLATVLQERGMSRECEAALQRALYLDPAHVLAHFALGNLRRRAGMHEQSRRHLRNALSALAAHPPQAELPDSEGMTVSRMAEIVSATLASEPAP